MTPVRRYPLTAIVLTQDEEINIRECLKTLAWADDVVVVDSGSRDRTIEIARHERPDVRIFSHGFKDFGDQRNWALDNAQSPHEWILFVDADERIPADCAEAIQHAVRGAGGLVGFFLCARTYFLGRWIRHSTMFPSWQLRLLRRGAVRFQKEGHGQREVAGGPLGYIETPYDHFGFSKGLEAWIARHNRYSTEEIELIHRLRTEPLNILDAFGPPVARRRFLKRLAARIGGRPVMRFVYLYFLRGGWLDGRPGLLYCLLRMAHEIHIVAKMEERRCRLIDERALH